MKSLKLYSIGLYTVIYSVSLVPRLLGEPGYELEANVVYMFVGKVKDATVCS